MKESIIYKFCKWLLAPYFFSTKMEFYHCLPKKFKRQYKIEKLHQLLSNFNLRHRYATQNPCKAMSLIELTNACNLNCAMCNTKLADRRIGFISTDTFEIILRKLKEAGSDKIGLFTVGEPLLHPDIITLLRIVNKYQFKALLSTNGQFPHLIRKLYKSVPNSSIVYRFSIDGAVHKTYESIRLGASFNALIESLEQVHKINRGKVNSRIKVFIRIALSMRNIYEIPEFFNVFGKYCLPQNIYFAIIEGISPDLTFFRKEFPFYHLVRRNVPCFMPFCQMHFTYDGMATLCCRDYFGKLVIGDIRKESISELWNGDIAQQIRRSHILREGTGLPCDNCYFPISKLNEIINLFIRLLNPFGHQISSAEFGDKVVDFLWKIDALLTKEDIAEFKKFTMNTCLKL